MGAGGGGGGWGGGFKGGWGGGDFWTRGDLGGEMGVFGVVVVGRGVVGGGVAGGGGDGWRFWRAGLRGGWGGGDFCTRGYLGSEMDVYEVVVV